MRNLPASAAEPDSGRRQWAALVSPALTARAVAVATEVAQRLRDRGRIEAACAAAERQTAFPKTVRWQPVSLAHGDAGLAVACAYLDACFPGEDWDRTGHGYLSVAAGQAEQCSGLHPALWGGMAGLGFAAWTLSRGGARYQRLLASVDQALLPQVTQQALRLSGLPAGMPFGEFDVISGLAGIGGYLLCRTESDAAASALDIALRALVALVADDGDRPRWWTPPGLTGNEAMAAQYPHGNLNCGLAHGIPGPLATMSLALLAGVTVPGLAEGVDGAAGWLARHAHSDSWGTNWPVAVPLTEGGAEAADVDAAGGGPDRSAWCYGSAGVARALWLAGVARDRADWRGLAVEAMRAVCERPVYARMLDSPTFCHGVSGLLQVMLRFGHDTGLPVFADAAAPLTEQLLGMYEPGTLAGYRGVELGGKRVNSPGLLDGAAGAVIVLLAATTGADPTWDRAFLLA